MHSKIFRSITTQFRALNTQVLKPGEWDRENCLFNCALVFKISLDKTLSRWSFDNLTNSQNKHVLDCAVTRWILCQAKVPSLWQSCLIQFCAQPGKCTLSVLGTRAVERSEILGGRWVNHRLYFDLGPITYQQNMLNHSPEQNIQMSRP
jgi:hypothetical protein